MIACCGCRAWRRVSRSTLPTRAAASNRRISIIVMNREAEDRMFRTAPEMPEAVVDESAPTVVSPMPPLVSRTEPAKQAR